MTPAVIIFPYNDPDPAVRRLHVRWMHGACGWAIAHGYAPVCSVLHMATTNDAPLDTDGPVRARVLDYSTTMAQMVGAAGGNCIIPSWCGMTAGMQEDFHEWFVGQIGCGGHEVRLTLAEIEPYMPRDLVGQVQAAVDEMKYDEKNLHESCYEMEIAGGLEMAMNTIENHTGITPTSRQRRNK